MRGPPRLSRAPPVERGELPLTSPIEGADADIRGPIRTRLMDLSSIQETGEYSDLHANQCEWQLVSESDAQPYMPEGAEPSKAVFDSSADKETLEIPILTSISIDKQMLDKKRGHVIHAGGAVWGLDFSPKTPSVDTKPCIQYLAIGGFRSTEEHHEVEEVQPTGHYKNCIQIWRCNLSVKATQEAPVLDMCILHDYGVVHDLKWCPFGAYEETLDPTSAADLWPKLGVLCAAFGNGSVYAIVVPHPDAVRSHYTKASLDSPIYLRIQQPRCSFSLPRSIPKVLSWGGRHRLAVGYTSGNVVVWDMEKALSGNDAHNPKLSYLYMCANILAHDSAVRAITWHGHSDPVNFVTAGNDGRLCMFDIRDPFVPMIICRTRGTMLSCAWPGHGDQLFFPDSDNVLRGYRTADCSEHKNTLKYMDNRGVFWALATSVHHLFIAGASSDGWLKISNVFGRRPRGSIKQPIVYKLMYESATKSFHYVDNLAPMTFERSKETTPEFCAYLEPTIAIHRASWSPNQSTAAWLATGGAAGLCRVDFVGYGDDWD